ncbi:MAG TPA: Smr/MutS family protein [Candidatus Binataceae bacterium]
MAKAKRLSERNGGRPEPQAPKEVFDSPFKQLKKLYAATLDRRTAPALKPPVSLRPATAPAPIPVPVPAPDEKQLFQEAFRDVRPLAGPRHAPPACEPGLTRTIVSEDAEVLAELSDLIAGQGEFDITETEEYVEGARTGLDPRLIVRLRRGEFPVEAHLDLHGMTQPDCRQALGAFIQESVRKGQRTVLVVPGRGLGSPGGRPVLKHAAVHWLSHGMLSAYVLGFVTARPTDGGAGALYVLLRRDRRRAAFDVLNGTKRHD